MKRLCNGWLGSLVLGAFSLLFPVVQTVQAHERTAYSFCSQRDCADGANPAAALIDVNGTLYGTTFSGGSHGGGSAGGTVFSFVPGSAAEKALYSFCSQANCTDGENPYAGVIDVSGVLYGTTYTGGSNGRGTVFSLDPGTRAEKVLYSFCVQTNCTDGAEPYASLIAVNGTLYGTTYLGGSGNHGTLFSLEVDTGVHTVVYDFCSRTNCTDGFAPRASLIDVNGRLYGTTEYGGGGSGCNGNGCGTVFSFDPGTGSEQVLYTFCSQQKCTDGAQPYAGLTPMKGKLYGTTTAGGSSGCNGTGCGTVFSLDPATGAESVLYSFCSQTNCPDGDGPYAGLIEVHGKLYGTTDYGGTNLYAGTVFSLDPETGKEGLLYSFCSHGHCTDGEYPHAGLVKWKGRLYGTTYAGGAQDGGAVFWIKTPWVGSDAGPTRRSGESRLRGLIASQP